MYQASDWLSAWADWTRQNLIQEAINHLAHETEMHAQEFVDQGMAHVSSSLSFYLPDMGKSLLAYPQHTALSCISAQSLNPELILWACL